MMDDRFKEAIKILTEKYARLELVERWRVDDARAIDGLLRENASLQQRVEALGDAVVELIAVATLRGDNELPHPADDPKLWTARMQTAWAELEALAAAQDKEQG